MGGGMVLLALDTSGSKGALPCPGQLVRVGGELRRHLDLPANMIFRQETANLRSARASARETDGEVGWFLTGEGVLLTPEPN